MRPDDISEAQFFIDRSRTLPLQAQLRASVVDAVLGGSAPVGARLPSTRQLAAHLGVARITVTQAYQELVAQGFLDVQARGRYSISHRAPRAALADASHRAPRAALGATRAEPSRPVDWPGRLGPSLSSRRHLEKPADWSSYPYPFIYGQADMSLFPHRAWRDCAWRAQGRRDFAAMASDLAAGDDPMLVNYIWSRALPRRGIGAHPANVLITMGAQQALWLAAQLLARDGTHAVCENPGYPDTATALAWSGARVSHVDVDAEGLPPQHLPDDVDLVFVTPSHQSPTSVTMPTARRRQLLRLARERDFVVIEDDYEFELRFSGASTPALKSLDADGRVIYVGSFSKALFPGLRLGYLVADEPFVREARELRSLILRHPPGHLQRTVAYFLALGHYDSLIRDLREVFGARRARLEQALAREGLSTASTTDGLAGSHSWVAGPPGTDAVALAHALRADGVLIEPGSAFFAGESGPTEFFRMACSSIALERIDEGVRRVAARIRA